MINVAITQRLTSEYNGQEIRESLDIRWYDFIKSCGFYLVPISVKQNIPQFLQKMQISGIIFSGGNDLFAVNPEEINKIRDAFEKELLKEAIKQNIPVIGVCRGMQLINDFFGGSLRQVTGHVATTHQISGGKLTRLVNSFHNYALNDIYEDFAIDFVAGDDIVEAFHHTNKDVYAIMWHPEREKIFKSEDIALSQKIFDKEKTK